MKTEYVWCYVCMYVCMHVCMYQGCWVPRRCCPPRSDGGWLGDLNWRGSYSVGIDFLPCCSMIPTIAIWRWSQTTAPSLSPLYPSDWNTCKYWEHPAPLSSHVCLRTAANTTVLHHHYYPFQYYCTPAFRYFEIYIHIHTYIYTYIHTYIHTYRQVTASWLVWLSASQLGWICIAVRGIVITHSINPPDLLL